MNHPEVTFVCHEECKFNPSPDKCEGYYWVAQLLTIDVYIEGSRIRSFDDGNFIAVYFGRLVRSSFRCPGSRQSHPICRSVL